MYLDFTQCSELRILDYSKMYDNCFVFLKLRLKILHKGSLYMIIFISGCSVSFVSSAKFNIYSLPCLQKQQIYIPHMFHLKREFSRKCVQGTLHSTISAHIFPLLCRLFIYLRLFHHYLLSFGD